MSTTAICSNVRMFPLMCGSVLSAKVSAQSPPWSRKCLTTRDLRETLLQRLDFAGHRDGRHALEHSPHGCRLVSGPRGLLSSGLRERLVELLTQSRQAAAGVRASGRSARRQSSSPLQDIRSLVGASHRLSIAAQSEHFPRTETWVSEVTVQPKWRRTSRGCAWRRQVRRVRRRAPDGRAGLPLSSQNCRSSRVYRGIDCGSSVISPHNWHSATWS